MTTKISIIVPAYNCEKYIEECIESIVSQTLHEFELILVDDGSTDSTGKICDQYAERDSRIKVLHMQNSGTFHARRTGVMHANGQIVTFADADDWLELNAFETALEYFQLYDIDFFTYTYELDGKRVKHLYTEGLYSDVEIRDVIIRNMMYDVETGKRRLDPSLCCKYMKKELYLRIADKIEEKITWGEDALITYPVVCIARNIYICNETLYHYRNNADSCTHTYPIERITELMNFQSCLKKIFFELDLLKIVELQIEQYMRHFIKMLVGNWFGMRSSYIDYALPYDDVLLNKDIVIYGAGAVGKSYICDLKRRKYPFNLIAWVDKNYMKMQSYNNVEIISPQSLKDIKFDFVLIAVKDYTVASKIITELKGINIEEERILWLEPIYLE